MRSRQRRNATDPWIRLQGDIEPFCRVHLRDQIHVRDPGCCTEAVAVIPNQLFHRRQSLADPMPDPLRHLRFIVAPLPQLVEYADVVQRMNIATDQCRDASLMSPNRQVGAEQRHLWITLLQVLDDGG